MMRKAKVLAFLLVVLVIFSSVSIAYATATPTGLKATVLGSSSIKLTWTAVSGATKYDVYQGVSNTAMALAATTTSATCTVTALNVSTTYYFKVRAYPASGTVSAFSAIISAKTLAGIAAPTGVVAAAASSSQINVRWYAVSGATSYSVYQCATSTGTYKKIATVSVNGYNNIGLAANTVYYYKVRAINANGEGVYSAAVSARTRPAIPAGLKAVTLSYNSIKLTWNAVAGATKYFVYRSATSTGTFTKIGEASAASSPAYTSTGLVANTSYYYKVSAVNAGGEGAMSSAATAKTYTALPAPANFSVQPYNYQSVQLYYDGVQNAVGYRIYYSKTASTDISAYLYFDFNNVDCRVLGLDAGTTYYFRVAAIDTNSRPGIPTGFLVGTTSASPGNPPQPKFYLYDMLDGNGTYRMDFYRSTSPIYSSGLDPTFEFYVADTQAGLSSATPDIANLNEYFYYDAVKGQSKWYGFRACYGTYKSTMQVLHVAALGKPANVQANGVNQGGNVYMSWSPVAYAAQYRFYYSVGVPYPGQSWFDFKTSAGSNLHFLGSLSGGNNSSAVLSGVPLGLQYYFFVVPADSNGVEGWFCGYAETGVIN